MGTDITALVEARTDSGWEPVIQKIWPNDGFSQRGESPFAPAPRLPRDYSLFAVLADIRNRNNRGTVSQRMIEVPGVGEITMTYDTDNGGHETIDPIDSPRGVPADASELWKSFIASTHPGFHDPSWLTLQEMEDATNWDQPMKLDAVIPAKDYEKFKSTGELPALRPQEAGGPGVTIVTMEEYDAGITGTMVRVRWEVPSLREEMPIIWWALLGMMGLTAPDGDRSRIRLMFVFDS